MPAVPAGGLVAVTGASGFVGSYIVEALLAAGYNVRALVRDPADEEKTNHLKKIHAEKATGGATLEFAKGDLSLPGSYDTALAGVAGLIHTAGPVLAVPKNDAMKEVVNPHIDGTKNVLEAAEKAGTIKRLVLTSSIAAILDWEAAGTEGKVFDESDWNKWSSVENGDPYGYAKTAGERLVMEDFIPGVISKRSFDTVACNPSVVLGPCLTKAHTKTSTFHIREMLYGNEQTNFYMSTVDVRDVALAHVEALRRPEAGGQRFIVCNDANPRWLPEWGEELQKLYPELTVSGPVTPGWKLWLMSFVAPKLLGMATTREPRFNNEASKRKLGITYRGLEETLKDTVDSMQKLGIKTRKR